MVAVRCSILTSWLEANALEIITVHGGCLYLCFEVRGLHSSFNLTAKAQSHNSRHPADDNTKPQPCARCRSPAPAPDAHDSAVAGSR